MALQQGHTQDNTAFNPFFGSVTLTMNFGVPNQVTIYADPRTLNERLRANLGLYVQDKWTRNRLTVNGGLRFDYLNGYVPEQNLPAGRFVPARRFDPIYDHPDWKDLSPRMGAAYDLFGDGRTALKGSLGRFPIGDGTSIFTRQANPVQSTVNSANRAWTDVNGDFIPQCDFSNFQPNGECTGALSNLGFGGVTRLTNYSDEVRTGFNVRPYNWEGSIGINHELSRGLGLGVAYFRRWFGNQNVTRNLLAGPNDYDTFCVTAPMDSRLREVSGQQICGYKDIKPALFGRVNNLIEPVSKYGKINETFNGVDLTVNARFPNGASLNGGLAVGKSLFDSCDLLAQGVDAPITGNVDLNSNVTRAPSTVFCHQETPLLNQLKIFGVYPLPWDLRVSANFQSIPGPVITGTYAATTAEVATTLEAARSPAAPELSP